MIEPTDSIVIWKACWASGQIGAAPKLKLRPAAIALSALLDAYGSN